MPPKGKASKDNKSDSKALITRGDRGVGKRGKRDVGKKGKAEVNSRGGRDVGAARPSTVKRDQYGRRPTTTKALVLRNGKKGAMGTGEVVKFSGKISGREKLELLAEDLMTPEGQKSLAQPLDFEKCIRLADSQYNERLDDMAQLRDPEFVFEAYKSQVEARTVKKMFRGRPVDPLEDKENVALIVGTVIHNSHMFASGWQVIRDKLSELDQGSTEAVREKLASDPAYREKYLDLLEFVDTVVDATYANMQVLLTTTPHYKKYFKPRIAGDKDPEPTMAFDWISIRDAYRSFLDSIIIELALPSSQAPKRVLFMILHEAVDEAPREARRFPQQVWDAFGDLSDILELQEMLVSPLRTMDGEKWRNETRQASEDLLRWQDAQLFSERASLQTQNWKNIIYPLDKISRKDVLNDMWKRVNDNYTKTCMADLETLWGLKGALDRRPKWTPPPKKPREPEPRLLTANGEPEEEDNVSSHDSMPDLQTISGSSDSDLEEENTYSDDEDDDSDDGESDAEDGDDEDYDSDDEEDLRILEREAMGIATLIPGIFDGPPNAEVEGIPEDKKDNPFVKLLTHLRGRMFSSKSKLRTTGKEEPRGGFAPSAPPAPAATPRNRPVNQAETAKGTVRVEEVEDEDDVASGAAKKKKKKPKKKKKAAAPGDPLDAVAEEGDDGEDDAPAEPAAVPELHIGTEPTPETQQTAEGTPKKSANKKKKKPAAKPAAAAGANVGGVGFGDSTTSFQSSMTGAPSAAQSAHSYMKETGAGAEKTKTKSRPDHPTMFNNLEKDKKPAAALSIPSLPKPRTLFGKMKRKTKGLMKRLIGTQDEEDKGDMRWEHFVKAMTDMGFSYNPSTAGSSVRFDPPDPKDPSITFHKPHPNSSLPPHMIRTFRKRLCDTYGWETADFYS